MRRLIDQTVLAKAVADGAGVLQDVAAEAYLASLSPRPTFGLMDDFDARRRLAGKDVPGLEGAPCWRAPAPAAALALLEGEAGRSARGLLQCAMRVATDYGMEFVRRVRSAERRWMDDGVVDELDYVASHSPLITGAALALRVGARLSAEQIEALRIERMCFDFNTLLEPVQAADIDAPKRIGAIWFGWIR